MSSKFTKLGWWLCRYHLVERAKDANIFGILVGTLGVGMFYCQNFSFSCMVITKVAWEYTELYSQIPCEAV